MADRSNYSQEGMANFWCSRSIVSMDNRRNFDFSRRYRIDDTDYAVSNSNIARFSNMARSKIRETNSHDLVNKTFFECFDYHLHSFNR